MYHLNVSPRRLLIWLLFLALAWIQSACATPTAKAASDAVFYHCVGLAQPVPPPNTWAKKIPVDLFEYGNYKRQDSRTIGGNYFCNNMLMPATALLRYRLDGRVIEKRFDLSALNPRRVANKTVEFYVVDDVVEVRLLSVADGTYTRNVELITKQ